MTENICLIFLKQFRVNEYEYTNKILKLGSGLKILPVGKTMTLNKMSKNINYLKKLNWEFINNTKKNKLNMN